MSNQVNGHAIRHAMEGVEKLPPLKQPKDPIIAAMCGLFTGGVGLGLYLESWLDFWVPFVALIVLGIVAIPTGEMLMYLAPVLWAMYGYRRAKSSNEKLRHAGQLIIEAEIVSDPAPTQRRNSPVKRPGLITSGAESPVAVRLIRIKDMLDRNVITHAEYEAKRAQIIREI